MNLQKSLQSISELMARFVQRIKSDNAMGLLDINCLSEDVLIPVFAEVYGYADLINLNTSGKNYPAIDLGDETAKVAFQISSDASSSKITDTLEKFVKYGHYEQYSHLIIYIITEKQGSYAGTGWDEIIGERFDFSRESDIRDYTDLLRAIRHSPIEKVKQVEAILEQQLSEAVKTSVGELTILYDETRHRFKESNNQCEVYRIGVRNHGETTVKNVAVRITSITTTREKQNDELRKLVGLRLCLSVNPFGEYSHPNSLPESSVLLHPGQEEMFDFVRLCIIPGNYSILHSNFFLNPQTSRFDKRPRGVLSPGKYTVTISAQGDDLNPVEQQFEFSSSSRGVNFRPVRDGFL